MNKRPDDPTKHGEVVTIDAPQLPAVIKKTKNPWKKFSVLDQLAECVRERYDGLMSTWNELARRRPGEMGSDWEYSLVDEEDRQKLARCRELIEQLDGPENYEPADDDTDDDEPILKKSVISVRLAGMMAAVHIGGPKEQEQEAFAKILLAHVCDAQVSRIVLEATCREIERTKKYMQATSEVLEVLKEQRHEWFKKLDAIKLFERQSERVRELLLEAQQKCELERAKAAHARAAQKFREKMHSLNYAKEAASKKQDEARSAYKAAETAMATVVEREQELEQARVELNSAFARVEQLNPPKMGGDSEESEDEELA
jgi:predicted RNA-binding Zn ribbon-like protein